jgi:hypothetical protein
MKQYRQELHVNEADIMVAPEIAIATRVAVFFNDVRCGIRIGTPHPPIHGLGSLSEHLR